MAPAQSPEAQFCQRVRYLIDRYDDGNVSEAARRMRVSQRGLAKVYNAEVKEPKLRLIQRVLRAYPHEDPMWILTGKKSELSERVAAEARRLVAARLGEMSKSITPDEAAQHLAIPAARRAGGR